MNNDRAPDLMNQIPPEDVPAGEAAASALREAVFPEEASAAAPFEEKAPLPGESNSPSAEEPQLFEETAAPSAEEAPLTKETAQPSGAEAPLPGNGEETPELSFGGGEYRYGPGSFGIGRLDQISRGVADAPEKDGPAGTTVRPAVGAGVKREPSGKRDDTRQRHSLLWLLPAVLLSLLVGIAAGALGYRLLGLPVRGKTAPTAVSVEYPRRDPGDLGGRIVKRDSESYTAPAQIYRDNVQAVVGISNESTGTNIWGQETAVATSGTGFIISEDGYLLTNYHVVKGAKRLSVTLYDGRVFPARLVGSESEISDVALLKIEADGLHTVSFGDSDALQVGEEVCTIGNPLGELTYSLSVGYVSAKERAINADGTPIGMLQTDAAINAGNSGGPLFDFAGNVVGIVTAKYSGETASGAAMEGLGFVIPINGVLNMLDDLQTIGYAAHRAYLGIRVTDASAVEGADLPRGAYISSVEEGFCGEKAGLQAGDVIVGLGGKTISSFHDLVAAMQGFISGQTVEITVWRESEYLKMTITFDARPQATG